MQIKLDENMPGSAARVLKAAGHDVDSAYEEGLAGKNDEVLFRAVRENRRVLITLDRDFSDVRTYPPEESPGVIVLRPRNQEIDSVIPLVSRLALILANESPLHSLWIVSDDRIRIRR